jgi:endonuclease YncB( thermonuclease family)
MRRLLPILLLIFAFPACAADYSARVIGIADGDTITVLTAAKTQHRIRLWGIDAPETGQDFGSRAKQAASALAFGGQVTIRPRDTDRYGRTVAEVILPDGRLMNREMVRQASHGGIAGTRPVTRIWPGSKARRRRRGSGYGASRIRCRRGNGGEGRVCRGQRRWSAIAAAMSITSRPAAERRRWPRKTG